MKKFLPDTNVFLRFLLNDIPNQSGKARELFKKAKEGKIELYTPQIIVFEIQFILEKYYSFTKKEIIEKLETIVSTDYLKVQDGEGFIKALDIFKALNISFVDSFLLALVDLKKLVIFSFDKKLEKLK